MKKSKWDRIYDILDSVYEDYRGTDDDWGEAISKVVKELKKEREKAVKNFADWVWDKGKLDLSKKDRVVKYYLKEREHEEK